MKTPLTPFVGQSRSGMHIKTNVSMAMWKSPLVARKSPHPVAGFQLLWRLLPVVSGVAHAVGLAFGDDDGGVVQEPVQNADGGGLFG